MFGSSEKPGRGEQRGRAAAASTSCGLTAKDLCGRWSPWWSPRYFTPPVSRVSKPLTLSTREPPPEPRKVSLSRIPIPGRAELSVSISMLGIRVNLITNFTYSLMEKSNVIFFSEKNITFSEIAFKSPSNGLEKGNGAITQLLLDPKSIFVPGNSCNIIINPSKPAPVHKQPASNGGSVNF